MNPVYWMTGSVDESQLRENMRPAFAGDRTVGVYDADHAAVLLEKCDIPMRLFEYWKGEKIPPSSW